MKASLIREYTHPGKLLCATQGSVQILPNGNVFVGWGSSPVLSEFSHGGEFLFDADFPAEDESYRSFRFPWKGHPRDAPAMAVERGPKDKVTLFYSSWNGATEVATWQVLDGPDPNELEALVSAPRKGFETEIVVNSTGPYIAVQALNSAGKVLGNTKATRL